MRYTDDKQIVPIPPEFRELLKLVRNLGFEETPDYSRYRNLIKAVWKRFFRPFESNIVCDWHLVGGFGLEIEDNITALEQQIFAIEIPPVPILISAKRPQNSLKDRRKKRVVEEKK